jgi:ATP-binding cassette subfamily B (MDR/TAP) protein 1
MWAVMCISRLYTPIARIGRAAAAAAELFAVMDAQVPPNSGLTDPDVSAASEIVFEDVTFAYPSRPDTVILNGLNVRFEPGKMTAVVGPSGSGKSTIVGLLERWYHPGALVTPESVEPSSEPSSAVDDKEISPIEKASPTIRRVEPGIYIGGTNLNDIDAKWWRGNIGLVQQEPFLFDDTIFNNVAYGLAGTGFENATEDQKRSLVKNACKEAYADEFISRLPQGYETRVGKGGMKISGGQRQRIAIARAIVKEPRILILDEATSAIDVRTERIVQKALDRVSQTRTTICIAHRLSTIRKADKIVVVRAGKVVEEGTHEQLLRNDDGMYSGFVRAQAVEMGKEETELDISIDDSFLLGETDSSTRKESKEGSRPSGSAAEKPYKQKSFMASIGILLVEQKARWVLYTFTMTGAVIGAGKNLSTLRSFTLTFRSDISGTGL